MPTTTQKVLCEILTKLSYSKRTVTLTSGKESNFYIAVGETLTSPDGLDAAASLVCQRIFDMFPFKCAPDTPASMKITTTIQAVAGVELGAVPLASAVMMKAQAEGAWLPSLIVRKQPKGHGAGGQVVGMRQFKRGLGMVHVVLVEDVVTTGGSSLRAAKVLQDLGAEVDGIIALVDRQEGAAETIRDAGFMFSAILDRDAFPQ